MPRIVSLIPAATEMVAALGLTDQLVGRSHECDVPAAVQRVPVLTASSVDAARPSPEIDRSVRDLLEQALSIYQLDVEQLAALQPDVVLTQTQCEVCAVALDQVQAALHQWQGNQPRLISLEATSLEGVWRDMAAVGAALGVADQAAAVVAGLRGRVAEIGAAAKALPRPRVATLEWIEPLMLGGYWIPELVSLAGGDTLAGDAVRAEVGGMSPQIDWPALVAADPEVIVIMPCGFGLPQTRAELHHLTGHPDWGKLAAVQAGRVFLADGNRYFNRPGPALVESLEILAEILHPEAFSFGHEGRAWERPAG